MGWSSGGTQQLILVKVCQSLDLETSLSLQENVVESLAVSVGWWGGHKRDKGDTNPPIPAPPLEAELPGKLKRSFFSQEIISCLFISTSRQINSISNSICQEEEELLEQLIVQCCKVTGETRPAHPRQRELHSPGSTGRLCPPSVFASLEQLPRRILLVPKR